MNDVRQSNHFTIPIFQSAVVNPLLKMTDTMYAMKPVFDLDAEVEVPGCMYSLPVIQSSNRIPGVGASATTSTFVPAGVVKALEVRQDAIQARLEKLKTEVAAYKKMLAKPRRLSVLLIHLSLPSLRLTQLRKYSASFGPQ